MPKRDFDSFISLVWRNGAAHARNELPWRFIDDPYAVYVSEAMLQQTQVARVQKYWPAWMQKFPTLDSLAAASVADVLEAWQGLGYNRRALSLKKTADICSQDYKGKLPPTYEELCALPGIGPATAAGILNFALQIPAVYIETNVRSVYIHHFFADVNRKVSDKEIAELARATLSHEKPREWNYALLDYGAALKHITTNPSRKAASYTRQSPFEGSTRQKRSFLVREVLANPGINTDDLFALLIEEETQAQRESVSYQDYMALIEQLIAEGFFVLHAGCLHS